MHGDRRAGRRSPTPQPKIASTKAAATTRQPKKAAVRRRNRHAPSPSPSARRAAGLSPGRRAADATVTEPKHPTRRRARGRRLGRSVEWPRTRCSPAIAALSATRPAPRMLHALMDGRALTATELAQVAGVAPQTASGHLAQHDGGRPHRRREAGAAPLSPAGVAGGRADAREHHAGRGGATSPAAGASPSARATMRCAPRAPATTISPDGSASRSPMRWSSAGRVELDGDAGLLTATRPRVPRRHRHRRRADRRAAHEALRPRAHAGPASTGASGGRTSPAWSAPRSARIALQKAGRGGWKGRARSR